MGIINWLKRINRTGSGKKFKNKSKNLIKDSRPVMGNYNESIKRGLYRAGIPRKKHFVVLEWLIGKDFFDLGIHMWPKRIFERHNRTVLGSEKITEVVYRFSMLWRRSHNI